MSEMAKVFEDRHYAGVWRVEWIDDAGDCEIALFAGPGRGIERSAMPTSNTAVLRRLAFRHILTRPLVRSSDGIGTMRPAQ